MTSKDKALELVDKFIQASVVTEDENINYYHEKAYSMSIQCALVCINEVIDQWEYIDTYISDLGGKLNPNLKYWNEVKEELLKL